MSIFNAKISAIIPFYRECILEWLKVGNYLKIGLKR